MYIGVTAKRGKNRIRWLTDSKLLRIFVRSIDCRTFSLAVHFVDMLGGSRLGEGCAELDGSAWGNCLPRCTIDAGQFIEGNQKYFVVDSFIWLSQKNVSPRLFLTYVPPMSSPCVNEPSTISPVADEKVAFPSRFPSTQVPRNTWPVLLVYTPSPVKNPATLSEPWKELPSGKITLASVCFADAVLLR